MTARFLTNKQFTLPVTPHTEPFSQRVKMHLRYKSCTYVRSNEEGKTIGMYKGWSKLTRYEIYNRHGLAASVSPHVFLSVGLVALWIVTSYLQ